MNSLFRKINNRTNACLRPSKYLICLLLTMLLMSLPLLAASANEAPVRFLRRYQTAPCVQPAQCAAHTLQNILHISGTSTLPHSHDWAGSATPAGSQGPTGPLPITDLSDQPTYSTPAHETSSIPAVCNIQQAQPSGRWNALIPILSFLGVILAIQLFSIASNIRVLKWYRRKKLSRHKK